ncbi:glycoside hydrolase family 43 protein [Dactylosporangium sp. NBC_01737]|uniref:glycoside hydrolase family 43 protein n=1 Tax=Dactylosporangium sp. NBC_01737 TaxID=2975959 RepID=UPI002E12DE1F|nr:glycoside hydrolase family 43 protein [Dactylosporangium sp. NBC_01737]
MIFETSYPAVRRRRLHRRSDPAAPRHRVRRHVRRLRDGVLHRIPVDDAANYGLHLAVSADGLNWTPLNQNNPVATPTLGSKGLRDPFVLRKQNGGFVVLATDLNGTDSAATGGHNVLMVNYTSDFVTASAPQTFFDPGYDAIDGDFVSVNGVNYMYFKNNTQGTLYGARSSTLNPSSFTVHTAGIRPGRGVEAPQITKSNTANTWYMWGDTYSPNGRFFCWQTSDMASGSWSLLNDRAYTQPLNSKHPGIAPITAAELSALTAKWPAPAWNRLKSYNFPDRYVRHANNVGRIDVYPFDPYQDQLWTLVPGLADAAGVSFRSVNFPDRYLRHVNYAIQLAVNDGTSTFKAGATFTRTAGLADSSWASFRSYNFPDRYLRHANYVLRIDPITSGSPATDKQDATFRVGY